MLGGGGKTLILHWRSGMAGAAGGTLLWWTEASLELLATTLHSRFGGVGVDRPLHQGCMHYLRFPHLQNVVLGY